MGRDDVIGRWFEAWLRQDAAGLEELFAPDAVYSECYGPEYHGLPQIRQWFADWNQRGRVLQWDIRRIRHCGETAVAEWYFCCDYGGNVDGFDGVSLIDFDREGKIAALREFQSKAEHCFPYET